MPRKPRTPKTTVVAAPEPQLPDGLVNEDPVVYPLATASIVAQQVYSNPDRHPDKPGPWSNEADKVAWVDEEIHATSPPAIRRKGFGGSWIISTRRAAPLRLMRCENSICVT